MPGYEYDLQRSATAGYDAHVTPERLDGVRSRRILAFIFDYVIVGILCVLAGFVVFFLGILTFGLGWLLFPVLWLAVALFYVGSTMGGPSQATPGMKFFSIRIERDDGSTIDGMTAIVHAVIFWVAHITFTPLMLVISLFSPRKKLIQDILLGTVIVRSDR